MEDTDFSAAVLAKLPLADSVWRLLHFMMADAWLDDLWDRTRGRCQERVLRFGTLAHLVAEALLQHGGSGRQAFERGKEKGRLPVSLGSVFVTLDISVSITPGSAELTRMPGGPIMAAQFFTSVSSIPLVEL